VSKHIKGMPVIVLHHSSHDRMLKEVTIALVGKYTKLEDAYTSVVKALRHAAMACDHKLNLKCIEADDLEPKTQQNDPVKYHEAWQQLCSSSGVIVPGGFGVRGVEGKILAAQWARKTKKPFLGVCLGMQCAVIEFARNVIGWTDAHSMEANPKTEHPVVIEMPEHHPGDLGGTMRLGKRRTIFKNQNSLLRKLYGDVDYVEERHRHRYEVNPKLVKQFEEKGLHFVGQDIDGERMEVMELAGHPYFVAVQYHPEYLSRPMKPSAPYLGLLLSSCGKLGTYLMRGCRLSPSIKNNYSDNEISDDEAELEKLTSTLGLLSSGETSTKFTFKEDAAHNTPSKTQAEPL